MTTTKKKRSEFQLTPAAFAKLSELAIYHKKPKSEVVELLILSEKQDQFNTILAKLADLKKQQAEDNENSKYLAQVNSELKEQVNAMRSQNKKIIELLVKFTQENEQQNNKPSGFGKLFGG